MTLAVATQDPSAPAETYVRQHMRKLKPGGTVGLGLACRDAPPTDLPFLCLGPVEGRWRSKLASIENLVRSGYAAAVPRRREAEVTGFLAAHQVGAVLAEFGTTGCALRRICKDRGIRMVVNFHGYDATVMPKRPEIRYAYRLLARDADAFVCGSWHFREILLGLGFPAERVFVVPCGVEVADFAAAEARDPELIVAVGRLTAKKRTDLVIRALARAQAAHPGLRLEVIGDGPMRGACERLVRELGLGDRVTLHGSRDHGFVKAKLAEAGMFVQHSMTAPNGDQESQGVSLLEAMAASLPVVTTDHNGFAESVLHGETGLLSPEGDVAAMADSIARLAGDPELRLALGRNGRARVVAEFDADAMAARLRAVLFDGAVQ
jgi:colanic acid/amylovoran biosynthesis glycosyltransferase